MNRFLSHLAGYCLAAGSIFVANAKPGVVGEYFIHKSEDIPADKKPFFVKVDKQVNFKEQKTEFNGSKLTDNFIARWQGVLSIKQAGAYQFHTTSDDGSRLYVGGKRIVDNWGPHAMETKSGTIELAAGDHDFKVVFQEIGGGAGCIASWTPPGGKKAPIPANVLSHRPDQEVAWDQTAWKKKKKPRKAKKAGGGSYNNVAWGPFQRTAVGLGEHAGTNNWGECQKEDTVYRAIVIPFNDKAEAGIIFDADTMRMATGWTKGGMSFQGLPYTGAHAPFPSQTGDRLWHMPAHPGWAKGSNLTDPREGDYPKLGPLPKDWAQYKGLYRHGDKVVLNYTVGSAQILELPALENGAITRTFEIANNSGLTIILSEAAAGTTGGKSAVLKQNGSDIATHLSAIGAPAGSMFAVQDDRLVFKIAAAATTNFKLVFAESADAAVAPPQALKPFTKAGPKLWKETAKTKGELGTSKGPYVLDRVTVPYQNPWGTSMRIGGMDFFSDGTTAAVSTWNGDVYIVKGIEGNLENLEWTRFASGGHETLGLKIVDDVIYTVDDSQITRYHDYNNDGEADFYECFNADWDLTSGFHAFCFDLHTDPAGNFYFAFGAPVRNGGRSFMRLGRHHGSVLRVSKDGSKLERYATGFRAPNGIGVSPTGQVTTGDNEGTFVPRSPLNWVKEGSFNGVVDTAADHANMKTTATIESMNNGRPKHLDLSEKPKPIVWMPKDVDNSGGGQAWVTSDKWGPFSNELLHMSYGQSSLYLVMKEEKNGIMQGGVTKFPLKFTSSCMRARFNHKDGQLYVAGLRGWQTNAAKDGGFDRIRYTGKPVAMPNKLKTTPTGLEISFTSKLDAELANDPGSFFIRAANIAWTQDYGSKEYQLTSTNDKKAQGWTTLKVTAAKLQADGKTIALTIDGIQAVDEMEIRVDLETVDGDEIITKIHNTIHEL